jgi:WD40 repeat protein
MRAGQPGQWWALGLLALASFALDGGAAARAADKPNPALRLIEEAHTNSVVGIAFLPDGKALISSSRDKTIRFWDPATGKQSQIIRHTEPFGPIACSPDGKTLAALSDRDRVVILYDPDTQKEKARLTGFTNQVLSLTFSPNGQVLATKEEGAKEVTLWDVAQGEKLRTLKGHTDVCDFHRQPFSPDGKLFVTGSKDETIRIWDVASGKPVRVLKGHDGAVYCAVAFSPDGKTLVSGGDHDKTVRLWDVESGKLKATLEGHTAGVHFVSFLPDGRSVLSLTADNAEVKLWDVDGQKEKLAFHWFSGIRTLPGYQCSMALSPDGQTLAVGINDASRQPASVYLWDLTKVKNAK